MRERDFDLHLFAARDAAMEGPAIVENAVDIAVILGRDRRCKFTPDQEMREVAEQLEVGKAIDEVEREIEIRRHPVAMRLEIDGEIDLIGQPPPTLDERHAVLQTARANVGLDIEMMDADVGGEFERRLEV